MANLFRILHTKFCQNRSGFVEDMPKHFGLFLFLDTVYILLEITNTHALRVISRIGKRVRRNKLDHADFSDP